MLVTIKEHCKTYGGDEIITEKLLDFKFNGTNYILTNKEMFNPSLKEVFISAYDMKLKAVSKSGMVINLYEKNITPVEMIINLA